MPDDKEKKKKKSESLGRLALDATKTIARAGVQAAGEKIWLEAKNLKNMTVEEIKKAPVLKNITVDKKEFRERPEDWNRRQFYVKAKPTRSYTQSVRTIHHAFKAKEEREPEHKKEDRYHRDPAITPGMDGLLSFSVLLAPFAILLGIVYVLFNVDETILIVLFVFYLLLIAIPGAYLGVDAIFYGARYTIKGGVETARFFGASFVEMLRLLVLGIWELFMFFVNGFFGFMRGAFDSFESWWAFAFAYIVSGLVLFFGINALLPEMFYVRGIFSVTRFVLLVVLPSLLPAAFAHRQWSLYRYRRDYFKQRS
ncbi:MAG: hypothetical protein ACXAEU_11350 [Candidatus Hodarchaeales archaeon]|jgi:hypothetical protein